MIICAWLYVVRYPVLWQSYLCSSALFPLVQSLSSLLGFFLTLPPPTVQNWLQRCHLASLSESPQPTYRPQFIPDLSSCLWVIKPERISSKHSSSDVVPERSRLPSVQTVIRLLWLYWYSPGGNERYRYIGILVLKCMQKLRTKGARPIKGSDRNDRRCRT